MRNRGHLGACSHCDNSDANLGLLSKGVTDLTVLKETHCQELLGVGRSVSVSQETGSVIQEADISSLDQSDKGGGGEKLLDP